MKDSRHTGNAAFVLEGVHSQEVSHLFVRYSGQLSVNDTMNAEAVFEIVSWEEEPFAPVDVGDKLTRVSVVKSYSGDIEGEGRLEYLMRYREDGSAEFYGLERVVGDIEHKPGRHLARQRTGENPDKHAATHGRRGEQAVMRREQA